MNENSKKAIVELVKSFGRFIYFGLLALIATFLVGVSSSTDLISIKWMIGDIALPVGVWLIAGFGFITKAIDKYIHENKNFKSKGIALKVLQK